MNNEKQAINMYPATTGMVYTENGGTMQKFINFVKHHIIITISIVIAIVLAIVLIVMLNDRVATLYFKVIPSDATISISQQLFSNDSSYAFEPGHYTAVVSKDGFETRTIDLTLEPDQTTFLNTYLLKESTTGDGFSYYKTNEKDLIALREYLLSHPEDEELKAFIAKYDHAQTIQSILPFSYYDETGGYYSVTYSTNPQTCDAIYCLEINATSTGLLYEALQRITDSGYDINFYCVKTPTDLDQSTF